MPAEGTAVRTGNGTGRAFITLALLLSAFGVMMVFSTTALQSNTYAYLVKQTVFLGAGMVACLLMSAVPSSYLRRASIPLLVLTACLLVAVLFSRPVKGAHRWLVLPFIGTVQPGEIARISVVLFTAWYLDRFRGDLMRNVLRIAVLVGVVGAVCGLILLQPDLGIPFVIVTVFLVMLLVTGISRRLLVGLVGIGLIGLVLSIAFAPHRMKRMTAFMDPWKHQTTDGYQLVQSYLSLSYGHLTGRGLGNSQFKENYLPEAHTDFIFAIIGEELGVIGTASVVIFFALFFALGIRLVEQTKQYFPALVMLGLLLSIVLQAYVNIGVVTGLLPTKGIGLPFISYGGSSLLTNLAAVGIIVGCWRQHRTERTGVRR